jgi:predicted transport protein
MSLIVGASRKINLAQCFIERIGAKAAIILAAFSDYKARIRFVELLKGNGMPLFKRTSTKLISQKSTNFPSEKDLQNLIEKNLSEVFNCKFIATEFSTGTEHAGRIDTLALSEDGNPVIIEYKKSQSSELITQSLYYLSWLNDHRGDFQVAAEKTLGAGVEIEWDDIRVICIAPSYSKFDLHAVRVMGANIELWHYRLYEDGSLYFDEIYRKTSGLVGAGLDTREGKNPVMVAAGKKAAVTRATGVYNFEQHLDNADSDIKKLLENVRDFVSRLDESVEETPKKLYIAYKVARNFLCVEVQKRKLLLFLKLDPKDFNPLPGGARDVSNIGHFGTGDLEFTVKTEEDWVRAQELIRKAFEEVGG